MSYREPTSEDIGEIIEVTDYGPEVENRHWMKQRLLRVEKGLGYEFLAGCTYDTVQQSLESGDYDGWFYARIKENKNEI